MPENKKRAIIIATGLGLAGYGIYKLMAKKVPPTPPPGLANLYGQITDASTKKPILGAVAVADGNSSYTAEDGVYTIARVTPGDYQVGFESDGYETVEYSVTIAEGNNELNVELTPIQPLVTFILIAKNAPAGAYDWTATPVDGETKGDYIQNPLTLTSSATSAIRIIVESELGQILLNTVATGTFKDNVVYTFDCSTLKFGEYVEMPKVPSFVSLSIPGSVPSGGSFNMASTWYFPGAFMEYNTIIYVGTLDWRNTMQEGVIINPVAGNHVLSTVEKAAVYSAGDVPQRTVLLPIGKYPLIARLRGSTIVGGISPGQHFKFGETAPTEISAPQYTWDFGTIGYLNVV